MNIEPAKLAACAPLPETVRGRELASLLDGNFAIDLLGHLCPICSMRTGKGQLGSETASIGPRGVATVPDVHFLL